MTSARTPDAAPGWVDRLGPRLAPYARLARWDRPAGAWLLFWPCGWGLALSGGLPERWPVLLLFALGAVAMRSAGCVWNDIVDRDLDARVARTRGRPVASGAIAVRSALAFLVALALVGAAVLLFLRPFAAYVALGSLALVALYPFMKRITWWPQAWLGLTFNWGVLVGWAEGAGALPTAALVLYAAGLFWTLGYDTIYALQDIEDDAVAGVRSSARRLGGRVGGGVIAFYLVAAALLAAALWLAQRDTVAVLGALPFLTHLLRQCVRLDPADARGALSLFRSNVTAGGLAFLGCLAIGLA